MSTKKEKIIFWMIGVGCGMGISGMIGIGVSLNMLNNQIQQFYSDNAPKEEISKPLVYEVSTVEQTENDKELPTIEKDQMVSNKEDIVEEPKEQVSVFIPAGLGAGEISKILEENDIIEDANAFMTYIANHDMSRNLRQGKFEFPVNISYEEALEILLRKK